MAPGGSGAAVSEVIGSPFGSEAVTVKERSALSQACSDAGAVTTGARSTLSTEISVEAVPVSAFAAVNVTRYVPHWERLGVQLNVPTVFPGLTMNVAPGGSGAAVSEVIGSPSGSAAVTVKRTGNPVPQVTASVAGAATTGLRSMGLMVICVTADPVKVFVAVNVTLYVPAWVKLGVQENVPAVLAALAVNVANWGRGAAVSDAIASPSGSTAVTPNESGAPSFPVSEAGAVTTGGRSQPLQTAIAVAADPDKAFAAVNVTL